MPNDSSPASLVQLFLDRVRDSGSAAALLEKQGDSFHPYTWNELAARVDHTAAALVELGVQPGDRVVQISENRAAWIVADLAIMTARAVHVPLHASLAAPQIAAQTADCGARVVLISGEEQAAKLASLERDLPREIEVRTYDPCQSRLAGNEIKQLDPLAADDAAAELGAAELGAAELGGRGSRRATLAAGQAGSGARLEPTPDDTATILYTSGTTGEPKGVMLSHRNLLGNAQATLGAFAMCEDDLRLSFLPWSHVFARTCGLYTWIASGATLAVAESREQIVANCQQLQPTLLNGVPYFFDKLLRSLTAAGVAEQPGALQSLLGGRMRMCCSGGAALPVQVGEWFERQGVPLIEGYGLTETSPVISVCRPAANRIGTVGPALDGVEVQIAEDGEILTRGDYVMQGYYQRPEATAEVIHDGWFHTGDLGTLDADGFLTITGRKKEIIVTAAGKNVSPVQLESLLTADPLIDQALVLGDNRNYLAALLVPNRTALAAALSTSEPTGQAEDKERDPEQLDLGDERIQRLYRERIDERLSGVSHYEQIGRFCLLAREFSAERGELTPTLKLRRHAILENFADEVASFDDKASA